VIQPHREIYLHEYRGIVTDVRGDPFGSPQTDRSVAALAGLDAATRRRVVEEFFGRWPGADEPPGLGRAVADFQEWELASGRIVDGGGSRWWAVVNGALIADLAEAGRSLSGDGPTPTHPGARAWVDYATVAAPAPTTPMRQEALWSAHQVSIGAGAAIAEPLLTAECRAERRFARLVLLVVEDAARQGTDTSTDGLAQLTRRLYPPGYPIEDDALDTLVARLGRG
jgi:hypothetical protein